MAATVEGLRAYLRQAPDDPETLDMYLAGAREKARRAGIPDYPDNALYDLFLYSLATLFYEKRSMAGGEEEQKMLNSFVLSLR